MLAFSRLIAPEDILRLSSGDKSRFMHDALTEAHMYGVPDVREWLNERYGLTRDQTLELALDILTANGSQPLSN